MEVFLITIMRKYNIGLRSYLSCHRQREKRYLIIQTIQNPLTISGKHNIMILAATITVKEKKLCIE